MTPNDEALNEQKQINSFLRGQVKDLENINKEQVRLLEAMKLQLKEAAAEIRELRKKCADEHARGYEEGKADAQTQN